MLTYYSGFCFVEANQIASGFGYVKSTTGEESFNNIKMINMVNIELATNFTIVSTNWNVQIHLWLKNYVFIRLLDRSKPRGAV